VAKQRFYPIDSKGQMNSSTLLVNGNYFK